MTEAEARTLKVGDRVRFATDSVHDGEADGTVSGLITHGVTIDWDDGQIGSIAFTDAGCIWARTSGRFVTYHCKADGAE